MEAVLSAIFGYAAGEFIAGMKKLYERAIAPCVTIEERGAPSRYIDHTIQMDSGEYVKEVRYSVTIGNYGRTVARNVKVLLTQFEVKVEHGKEFTTVLEHPYELKWKGSCRGRNPGTLDLVPGARLSADLCYWREDLNFVAPDIEFFTEYFEEVAEGSVAFRLKVAAFGDDGRVANASLELCRANVRSGAI